jgi:nucleosome binding factor SPN SPT16 subunit
MLHSWLMSYQFSETIIVLTKKTIGVFTSQQKKEFLEAMEIPEGYQGGPKLLTVLRDPKADPPEYLKFVESVYGKDAKIKGPVGTFAQE